MVQIEGSVASAIEDEDDDEGRGRFGTGGALKQVSAHRVTAPEPANKECPDLKPRYNGVFHIPRGKQTLFKTDGKLVRR
jgi:hypothetical protein